MSQGSIEIRIGAWSELSQAASAIRYEVFVHEQHVPLELELDEMDVLSVHALAVDAQGRGLATGRLLPDGHIGRMAVLQAERKKGLGAQVLRALIEVAKRKAYPEVILGAQLHAKGFYVRQGFIEFGDVFMDANIPHIMMRMPLV
ncbi:MAG: GNAT family N-acetyltransferase [Burkholderiales bacterium]|nr:GNAT family N-acetyltransferase [Burkholderiales bacterium]MDP4909042.1 GNAT family N-acetyltransferase [Burkholderiaceae bacterium]